ncbi:MAG TPA: hypothetical protein P5150_04545, partial [Candidatus Ratteibacteria bacterium]|nr:hypothetical protein [Candidatus Ratteibacteria bacterium]
MFQAFFNFTIRRSSIKNKQFKKYRINGTILTLFHYLVKIKGTKRGRKMNEKILIISDKENLKKL